MTTSRGEEVRRRRLLRGLEQEDLAKLTGVSVRTLGRIESGKAERSRSLPTLEQHLGIEPDSVRVEAGPPASVTLAEASRLQIVQELMRREIEELQSGDVVRNGQLDGFSRCFHGVFFRVSGSLSISLPIACVHL
jgi:transcriptional regulator with XRE-family HTH domain